MSRYIDADALTKEIKQDIADNGLTERYVFYRINEAPSIDIEPNRGEWEEKETFSVADDDPIIERWQSARCSMCERYHTTPYMYYFNDYNFCPYCGADMREREGE